MESQRGPADDLLEVIRVLLLVQGAILVATTIEAMFWSLVFPGAGGASVVLSGAAALAVLVARVRVRAGRRGTRRAIYIVEGVVLATFVIDSALSLVLTQAFPPAVAVLTQFVLPLSVIALLRRIARASTPAATSTLEKVGALS